MGLAYLLTNIGSFLFIGLFFVIAFLMQRSQETRIFTTFNLAMTAIFCALSVVLTNIVGYSFIFGLQLMLGNFLIFLTGMMFGPLIGVVSAMVTDTVGALINLGGIYHSGFMLIKVILGFAGGFVFFFKTNAFWKTKMFGFFTLSYLIVTILSPIFLYSLYGPGYTMAKFISKLIRFPFELGIYSSLIYLTFKVSYLFFSFNHTNATRIWFMKNGTLKVHQKRSLREKYKLDLDGNQLSSRRESRHYYEQINYNNTNGVINYDK